MSCFCSGKVSNPKPKTCSDCLIANRIIIGCGQGLMPCGGDSGTTSINLNSYNHNPADAVYSLSASPYSSSDFASVSITAAGVITVVTGIAYAPHGLHVIKYEVVRGKYKDFGTVEFCFDDPCQTGCSKCNTCSGECYGTVEEANATIDCSSTGNTYNAATGLNIASCDGSNTWAVSSDAQLSAIIDSNGLITYDATNLAMPGIEYTINWSVTCSLYGMVTTGVLKVMIDDKCVGVTCDPGKICDKCTGVCIDTQSDLDVSGGAFGASGGSGGMQLQ